MLVIGCNYHTKWQSHKSMRFVLAEIKGTKARLVTRRTKMNFWTDIDDLIFINTGYNNRKAKEFTSHGQHNTQQINNSIPKRDGID